MKEISLGQVKVINLAQKELIVCRKFIFGDNELKTVTFKSVEIGENLLNRTNDSLR